MTDDYPTPEYINYPKIEIHIEDENDTLPVGFFSDWEMTWNGGSMVYSEYEKDAIVEEVKRRIENGMVQGNVIILPGYIGLRGKTLEQYRKRHGLQMYYPRYNDPRPPFRLAPYFEHLWQEQQARQLWLSQEQSPVNWQSLDEAAEDGEEEGGQATS